MASADMEKPKRAPSAYFLFGNSIRPQLMEENKAKHGGKCKVAEVAKEIGERWAKLDAAEKAKFEEQANAGKEKYEEEIKAYKEASDPVATLKQKYAELIPKKPGSSYWIFAQDPQQKENAEEALRKENQEVKAKAVSAKLGELWKGLSEKEKAVWAEKAKTLTTEYEQKLKVWQATPEFAELQRVEQEQKEKEKEQAEKQAQEEKESPKKQAKRKSEGADSTSGSPSAKKARGKAKAKAKGAEPAGPAIDEALLQKAKGLGLEAGLKNLASRSDIVAAGVDHQKILSALQASNGLVHPAKASLMGA